MAEVETELFDFQRLMFRVVGFGELVDLPYKGRSDLQAFRDAVLADPGPSRTPIASRRSGRTGEAADGVPAIVGRGPALPFAQGLVPARE